MYSQAARMGITFYLVRTLWCCLNGDDAGALAWAWKGVDMIKRLEAEKEAGEK